MPQRSKERGSCKPRNQGIICRVEAKSQCLMLIVLNQSMSHLHSCCAVQLTIASPASVGSTELTRFESIDFRDSLDLAP